MTSKFLQLFFLSLVHLIWHIPAIAVNTSMVCLTENRNIDQTINCTTLNANVPPAQTVNASNPCAILTAQPTGGTAPYTYLWSDTKTTPTTAACVNQSTTYYVTVTDAAGCQTVGTVPINFTSTCNLTVQSSPDQFINPGVQGYECATINVTPSGGSGSYSYLWNQGETTSSITRCPISASYAAVMVTDNFSGCTATTFTNIFIADCNTLTSDISPDTSVDPNHPTENTALLTTYGAGGSGNYTYLWSTGATTASIIVSPTSRTVYTVTITDTSNGCSTSNSVTVDIATVYACSDLNISIAGDDMVYNTFGPSCASLLTTASGGSGTYTSSWSTGSTTSSISVCPNQTTDYTVTLTDAVSGCVAVETFTVTYEDLLCGRRNNKILICKNNVTYCVKRSRVQRHLNQGASLGECHVSNSNSRTRNTPQRIFEAITEVSVSPNPFVEEITISYKAVETESITLNLLDITGRVVDRIFEGSIEGGMVHEFYADGSQLKAGLYILRIQKGDGDVMVEKILKN